MVDEVSRSAAKIAALVALPVALLAGLGVFALLNSAGEATGPVATEDRPLTEADATACRALLSQLPDEVGGLAQRPVTAGPEQNAAYGDPAIVLACGVAPAGYPPTDTVYPLPAGVGGTICWHAAEQPDASVWTTLDRQVPVQVRVPAAHDGPGQLVTELSLPVIKTLRPEPGAAPTGCSS